MLVTEETKDATDAVNPASSSASKTKPPQLPAHPDQFVRRHIGPDCDATKQMLEVIGYEDLDSLIDHTVPSQIRISRALQLTPARSEYEVLAALKEIAGQNQVFRSYIGM